MTSPAATEAGLCPEARLAALKASREAALPTVVVALDTVDVGEGGTPDPGLDTPSPPVGGLGGGGPESGLARLEYGAWLDQTGGPEAVAALAGLATALNGLAGEGRELVDAARGFVALAPLLEWAAGGCDPARLGASKARRPRRQRLVAALVAIGVDPVSAETIADEHREALAGEPS